MGTPFDNFRYWDPKDDYASTFWKAMKSGAWDKRSAITPLTENKVSESMFPSHLSRFKSFSKSICLFTNKNQESFGVYTILNDTARLKLDLNGHTN